MTRRMIFVALLLTLLAGCSEDSHKPFSRELVLEDLRLSIHLSSNRIVHGDTLLIEVTAFNPYSRPLDVAFGGYDCWEWFWVYDEQGEQVSPYQKCLLSRSYERRDNFHMEPREQRVFSHRWTACGVKPGLCTVFAGFNAPWDGSPHTAGPVSIEVLSRDEDVSGEWSGRYFGTWRRQSWGSGDIALSFAQDGHVVSGTMSVLGSVLQIESGLMENNQITFSVNDESEAVLVEFSGDVCGSEMRGQSWVYDAKSDELLDDMSWRVNRIQ